MRSPSSLFFLQAEQPHVSQPVLIEEVLQPSDYFCGSHLNPQPTGPCLPCAEDLITGHTSLGGISPEWSTGGESLLPSSGHTSERDQDVYGWLPGQQVHLWLMSSHLSTSIPKPFSSSPYFIHGETY